MLDSLVGTILTDARTVLDELDPYLLELEIAAERADAALLAKIYNTTPILSNSLSLLGLTDAVVLVDLLQLVTGAFRKQTLSLSSQHIREVLRGFSALLAFFDSADAEKVAAAIDALRSLAETVWGSEAEALLSQHTLQSPEGSVAFSVSGFVLQDEMMQECSLFVLELDETGRLAGSEFSPFGLLQFLLKSGQILGVQFAPQESGVYLQVLFATVLTDEQLQMMLDLPLSSIHQISKHSFDSSTPAWERGVSVSLYDDASSEVGADKPVDSLVSSDVQSVEKGSMPSVQAAESSSPDVSGTLSTKQDELPACSEDDRFDMFEAELGDALWEEALSSGIAERSLERASQEIPQTQPENNEGVLPDGQSVAAPEYQIEELPEEPVGEPLDVMYGYSVRRSDELAVLHVGTVSDEIQAEQLRAALLELLSSHTAINLVLDESIEGNLELLQLLLSAAMTAGLRRQQFTVSGKGKKSVETLLAGCGITVDVLRAQGIAGFLT